MRLLHRLDWRKEHFVVCVKRLYENIVTYIILSKEAHCVHVTLGGKHLAGFMFRTNVKCTMSAPQCISINLHVFLNTTH